MRRVIVAGLLALTISGCHTPLLTKKQADQQNVKYFNQYQSCLRKELQPYLKISGDPRDIADAVTVRCEDKLYQYLQAIKKNWLDQAGRSPDDHLFDGAVRAHGRDVQETMRKGTIAHVLDARIQPPN